MPTIRKLTEGTEYLHNAGRVSGGETVDVSPDVADYLVESGAYERTADSDTDEEDADAASDDAGSDEGGSASDDDADAEEDYPALEECTYQELRDLASDHDIEGRSGMDKGELVDALDGVL